MATASKRVAPITVETSPSAPITVETSPNMQWGPIIAGAICASALAFVLHAFAGACERE